MSIDTVYPLATALLARDDVSGVLRSAYRYRAGKWEQEDCIAVCVKKKKELSELTEDEVIPDTIGNVATDVIEFTVKPDLYSPTYLPVCGGISIGGESIDEIGTLGAIFYDTVNSTYCGLTNFHVLATGDTPMEPDTYVMHPGSEDGGIAVTNRIGKTSRWQIDEWADAAIFTLKKAFALSQLTSHQVISSIRTPSINDNVEKVGRSTGQTQGIVSATGLLEVDYSDYGYGTILLNVFAYIPAGDDPDEEIALGGDSGSLVYCTDDNAGLGLHVAHTTDPFTAFACYLQYVAEDLQFSLITPELYQLLTTGSFNVGIPTEHIATGSFNLVQGEDVIATKLFAVNDSGKAYGADDFGIWVQDLGYTDTSAFLADMGFDTVDDWLASWNGEYETIEAFLADQTVPTLKSALADNGVTL